MRNFLFLALGVAMVGCSSNDNLLPDEQNTKDISFVGYTQSASSRAALEGTTLPTDGSYALFLKARYQNNEDGKYDDYFVNATAGLLELEADETNNIWVAAGRTYPLAGKMNFMGFSLPKADASKVTSTWKYTTDGRVDNLSLKCEGRNGTEDILFSTMSSDFACPQTAVRALTFNHTLSWIRFTTMVNTEEKLIIKEIKLNDVVLDGTVTVPGTTTATSADAVWSALGDKGSYAVLNPATEEVPGDVLTTTKQEEYGYLIVVPGKRTTATITYAQITGKNSESGEYQTTADLTATIDLSDPKNEALPWLPGNRYSYNLSITSNNITFTTEVQTWIQNPQGFELK